MVLIPAYTNSHSAILILILHAERVNRAQKFLRFLTSLTSYNRMCGEDNRWQSSVERRTQLHSRRDTIEEVTVEGCTGEG